MRRSWWLLSSAVLIALCANPASATAETQVVLLGTGTPQAKPKLLLLYHCLFWGTTEAQLLEEIREGYHGSVAVGRDLGVY